MSQDDYDQYKEGFGVGEEAAKETGLSDKVQDQVEVWMGRYEGKSDAWWSGFHDGKEGNWDPPSEDDDNDDEEEEEEEDEDWEEEEEDWEEEEDEWRDEDEDEQ